MSVSRENTGVEDLFFQQENKIKWYHYFIHLGYYIRYAIVFFFSKPFKEEKKELDLLQIGGLLLEGEITDKNIEQVNRLVQLHRIVENTKARRRLEKWSLRVIAIYLFVVLIIVILTYFSYKQNGLIANKILDIPSEIMITILSTTTVNIIGLGLIVLRGHFLAKESINDKDVEQ